MLKKFVNDGWSSNVPLSPAVQVDNIVFISGQVPIDLEVGDLVKGDIKEQTKKVLERISFYINKCGGSMSDVVKTTVFLTDIKDFNGMNEVYGQFFSVNPPARSCIEVKLAVDAKIEIDAIAILPKE